MKFPLLSARIELNLKRNREAKRKLGVGENGTFSLLNSISFIRGRTKQNKDSCEGSLVGLSRVAKIKLIFYTKFQK